MTDTNLLNLLKFVLFRYAPVNTPTDRELLLAIEDWRSYGDSK